MDHLILRIPQDAEKFLVWRYNLSVRDWKFTDFIQLESVICTWPLIISICVLDCDGHVRYLPLHLKIKPIHFNYKYNCIGLGRLMERDYKKNKSRNIFVPVKTLWMIKIYRDSTCTNFDNVRSSIDNVAAICKITTRTASHVCYAVQLAAVTVMLVMLVIVHQYSTITHKQCVADNVSAPFCRYPSCVKKVFKIDISCWSRMLFSTKIWQI